MTSGIAPSTPEPLVMKTIATFAAAVALSLTAVGAQAAPFISDSSDTYELLRNVSIGATNYSAGASGFAQVITKHPLWATPSFAGSGGPIVGNWISFANTGIGGGVVSPNSFATAVARFSNSFTVAGVADLTFTVWADDTAEVYLTKLGPGGFTALLRDEQPTQDGACARGAIGCETGEGFTIGIGGLLAGAYRIDVHAFQRGADVFGAAWAGELTERPAVPEPATVALLGAGLLMLAGLRRRSGEQR
jgi:hypothetical protein